MRLGSTKTSLAASISIGLLSFACSGRDRYYDSTSGYDPTGYEGDDDTTTTVTTDAGVADAASVPEVKVIVESGKTLNALPGQGVGVFIEYATGGHWHVWWTCDTATTGQTCSFGNTFTSTNHDITNVVVEGGAQISAALEATDAALAEPYVIVSTTGATTIDGVTFDTAPGETIQIISALGDGAVATENGKYFFFVQNGVVNGNYTGTLTDPLLAVGSTP